MVSFDFLFALLFQDCIFCCFFDIAVEAVVFIDLVIDIQRKFVHSLVVST